MRIYLIVSCYLLITGISQKASAQPGQSADTDTNYPVSPFERVIEIPEYCIRALGVYVTPGGEIAFQPRLYIVDDHWPSDMPIHDSITHDSLYDSTRTIGLVRVIRGDSIWDMPMRARNLPDVCIDNVIRHITDLRGRTIRQFIYTGDIPNHFGAVNAVRRARSQDSLPQAESRRILMQGGEIHNHIADLLLNTLLPFRTCSKSDSIPGKNSCVLFWVLLTPKTLAMLPNNIRAAIMNELQAMVSRDDNTAPSRIISQWWGREILTTSVQDVDSCAQCVRDSGPDALDRRPYLSFLRRPKRSITNIDLFSSRDGSHATLRISLNEECSLDVRLCEITGRTIKSFGGYKRYKSGLSSIELDLGDLAPGIYLVTIQREGDEPISRRLVRGESN